MNHREDNEGKEGEKERWKGGKRGRRREGGGGGGGEEQTQLSLVTKRTAVSLSVTETTGEAPARHSRPPPSASTSSLHLRLTSTRDWTLTRLGLQHTDLV